LGLAGLAPSTAEVFRAAVLRPPERRQRDATLKAACLREPQAQPAALRALQGELQVQRDESVWARLAALRVSQPPVRWEAQVGEPAPSARLSVQGQLRVAVPQQQVQWAQRALLEVPLAQPEPAALRPLAPCQHVRAAQRQRASCAPLLLPLP